MCFNVKMQERLNLNSHTSQTPIVVWLQLSEALRKEPYRFQ